MGENTDTSKVINDVDLIRREERSAELVKAQEEIPPESENGKTNRYYGIALGINNGKKEFLYCLEEDKFYQYKDGCWTPRFSVEFRGILERKLKDFICLTLPSRHQVIENFKSIARTNLDRFNWSELINLENGMLNPYSGDIEPHDPMYYSTNRIPYKYDAGANCEMWLKTLGEIFEGDQDKIDILQEFFGYCLTRETKYNKAMLLLGESNSGKSTILEILRAMVGDSNCSSLALRYLNNAQHTPMLVNKMVNIDTEVSRDATGYEAEFKAITRGEPVLANQKYVSSFKFVPYCKLVMAANIFPKITDHSSAFYNRLILIPCDRVFSEEEQNKDLPQQLMKELPGILNWASMGLRRLVERKRFENKEFLTEAVEELESENNPSSQFFDEHIEVEIATNVWIEKGELYDKYKAWCEKNHSYLLSSARFASAVFKKYNKVTPKNCRWQNGGKRYWRNIKYVDFKGQKQETGEQVAWYE